MKEYDITSFHRGMETKKAPFRRAEISSQNSAFSLRPILDNTSISRFLLRVISNNLPIHLRVCAKMFTLNQPHKTVRLEPSHILLQSHSQVGIM